MDFDEALRATRNGAIAAFVSAGLTALVVLIAMSSESGGALELWNDPYNFVDVVFIVILGIGVLLRSRTAAIILFGYFVISKIAIWLEMGSFSGVGISLVFVYFYGRAVQGSFAYHRIRKEEDPDYKSTPIWMYFIGIPILLLVLVIFGFGLLTMTSLMPSPEILTGAEMASKDIAALTEAGILYPNERIEYFFSEGVFSIMEGGSILTDNRVIAYGQEAGEIYTYAMAFQEIGSIVQLQEGSFSDYAIYEVLYHDLETGLQLYLPHEGGGDKKFVAAVRRKVSENPPVEEPDPGNANQVNL